MKKTFLTIIFIFIPFCTFSQNKFGVLGGVNASSVSDGFLGKVSDFGFSFHLGAVYELRLKDKITFRPKLIYSQQGDRIKAEKTFYNENWGYFSNDGLDYELSYLNVPLNIKFFDKTYLLIGPQVGFLLSTKKLDLEFGDIDKTVDFGINLGLGHRFKDFFIELNLYQGMTTLLKYEGVYGFSQGFDATNSVAQLSFGYYFK